ncbi:MAG: hypothetical protein KatS3mg118_3654 [Paracoccaceae bacterium]|nr:MAG: hypothetical protein KatS3mg118_3654 [Paracoccaceae bacterium]
MTDCTISWTGDHAGWEGRFARLRRTTLLQCRAYAEVVCPPLGQRVRHGLILIGGAVAGLVQLQEAALLGRAIHAVILDRGPLWEAGRGGPEDARAFLSAFARAFPARPGRRRRLLPELPASALPALGAAGFARLPGPGYQTFWLDLTPGPDALRRGMEGKWRNRLSRAEEAGLEVVWDRNGLAMGPFLRGMAETGAARHGPAPATLIALAERFRAARAAAVGLALHRGEAVAGVMMLRHGLAATWQAGWVSEAGRRLAANHLLLWRALCELHAEGVQDLDLGGVNDADAAGVKRFKRGLGGELVELAGQFR